jgi:magnesium-protoporphyrin O-methyltransferase
MSASCCGYAGTSSSHFGPERAAADLARYHKNGLDRTTHLLAEGIRREAPGIGSLLDIGSGIGALTFEVLEHTQARAVMVEASSAFRAVAGQESARRRVADRVAFAVGDFVELAPELRPADLVTMDRVVCCYPSSTALLETGLAHATEYFAFSYPRELWYVRAVTGLENLRRRLRRNPFRTYVHPVAGMHAIMRRQGFELVRRRRTLAWAVEVWRRMEK